MTELLAPAGSREAFTAALESGADAIYLGGCLFGARHYASNFSNDELITAVRDAHLRGVSVYVTVNTLVDDREFSELADYLQFLYNAGVDAIIVQDVGVAALARKVTPGLKLHASTQMTVHNLAGVQYLADIGFQRVVLARELPLEDIRYICKNSPVEIEVFIHGALCISYSGQCLMSSMIGGRSGNRGKCAQPCRLPYKLVDESNNNALAGVDAGNYLLSPKDLCGIEVLPEYIQAGVVSLKVEGRMKRPEYVAVVVDSYRRAIDACMQTKMLPESLTQDIRNMAQIFNRGFTKAYLLEQPGRAIISDRRPNNRGVRIGRVTSYQQKEKQATIKLDEGLAIGDIIDFWIKVGGRTNSIVKKIAVNGQNVDYAPAGVEAVIPVEVAVKPGDRVFKTHDAALMEKARSFYSAGSAVRRIPVDITVTAKLGEPLVVTLRDREGNVGVGQTQFIAEKALKRPLTEEVAEKQLGRLGTTVFALHKLIWAVEGELMVPLSELNEARRCAVTELEEAKLAHYKRVPLEKVRINDIRPRKTGLLNKAPLLSVNVDTVDKAGAALQSGADIIIFGGDTFTGQLVSEEEYHQAVSLARNKGKQIILGTPRLVTENCTQVLRNQLDLFSRLAPDAVSVSNVGSLHLARHYKDFAIHGDYPLNVFNSTSIDFFRQAGVESLTLSPELNFSQIEKLGDFPGMSLECLVHGYLELMISEYCVMGSFLSRNNCECENTCHRGEYKLSDRLNEKFRVVGDQFCRMHVLNAKELSLLPHVAKFKNIGVERIRVEGKALSAAHIRHITWLYRQAIDAGETYTQQLNQSIEAVEHDDITRGHYFRGVL
ncbi:MAG: peptidase [Firmicutes bacterium]|nr:peptidase [Bacillota bacterium]